MHPIHYSLIINLITIAVTGILGYLFAMPWLVLIAILVQTHAIDRFRDQDRLEGGGEDDDDAAIGFTANIK